MTTLTPYLDDQTGSAAFGGNEFSDPIPSPQAESPQGAEVECLCPFCGTFNLEIGKPCSNCHVEDTSATRAATRQRLGSWFVLQSNNPSAPGMNFEELQTLVRQNVVTSRSVVRGPSTSHLWRLASKVRGLSREFGLCHSCGGDIETTEISCPHCDRPQTVQEEAPAVAPRPQPIHVEIPEPKPITPPKPAEPTIHVHTLSDATGKEEFEYLLRPVIAEQSERHIPKDDLLTPRDVAKAFQLEFGIQNEQLDRYFDRTAARRFKILITSAVSLMIAVALAWPVLHAVTRWINAMPVVAQTPNAQSTPSVSQGTSPSTLLADARTASDQIPGIRSEPITEPAPRLPALRSDQSTDPIILADPTPTASPEDDPNLLWNSGLDAESTGNYTKAVAAYERIESLPSYQWPTHLEVRLELARKELKGEMKP